MSYIDTYAPAQPKAQAFGVKVCAFADTVTMPEAQRVHAALSHDPRTRYISPILDSEMDNGYTINFEMECPCLYFDDGFTANPYADWQDYLTDPLPDDCVVVDYQIL